MIYNYTLEIDYKVATSWYTGSEVGMGAKVSSSRLACEQALHLGDILRSQPRGVRADPRVGRLACKFQ